MKTDRCKIGLTLVELLIAVAVVVILISIVLVAGSSLRAQAEERLAAGTISILVTALEQYYEFHDEFPKLPDPLDDVVLAETLYRALWLTPNSKTICEQINSLEIVDTDKNDNPEFYVYDPWDNPLRYEYNSVEGWNFPRITSAGPDGNFNTEWDNITSKGR